MGDYRRLQYSIGGGIIDGAQRAEQNGSATIVIGLGGTGKDAIKRLKKEVYQRITPDNPGDVVPKYSHIRYLSIDTDRAGLWKDTDFVGIDEASEFFHITGDPGNFTSSALATILAGRPYARWLNTNNITLQSAQGAGGVRQIGRYFLIEKSDALVRRLQTLFAAAVADLDAAKSASNDVNIHVMTGLGGGTGAGTFLDVCYIIQYAISTCPELNEKNTRICGYFFLPDVSLETVRIGSVRDYIMYNSFAAMKELDYCMNFPENGDRWDQQYNGFAVNTTRSPVDIAYLISAQSVSANVVSDGYDYAMGVVSDYVVHFISGSDIHMDSYIVNYSRFEALLPKPHGVNYKYVILGAARAVLPVREIATYLASGLFERMARVWDAEPTDADIEAFMERLGMTVEKLNLDIGEFDIQIPQVDNTFPRLPEDDAGDRFGYSYVLPEPILGPFNRMKTRVDGTLKAGHDALVAGWTYGMDPDDSPKSIVCRIYKELKEVLRDPKKGPIYAAKMLLGSDKKNIINILSDLHRTATADKDEAFENVDLRTRAVNEARHAYNKGLPESRATLFNNLLMALRADIAQRCEHERLRLLCDALEKAKEQLIGLYRDLFGKYAGMIADLTRVFEENKAAITDLQDTNDNPFTLPLVKISDVRDTLDDVIAELDIEREIVRFQDAFFEGAHEIWDSGDEDKIGKWISEDMLNVFRPYLDRPLDEYMRQLYPQYAAPEMASALTEQVKEDVIGRLDKMASELFLLEGARAPRVVEHLDSFSCCSVPSSSPIVCAAADWYAEIYYRMMRMHGDGNEIFFLRCTSCVPLCAYGLIDQCYKAYRHFTEVAGKHLYEGTEGDPRNWNDLPDLRPCSIYQDDWATPEKEAILAAYDKAEREYGIIHPCINENGIETERYMIWRTPDYRSKVQAVRERIKQAEALANAEASSGAAEMLQKVSEALAALQRERYALQAYREGLIDYQIVYETEAENGASRRVRPEIEPLSVRNDGDYSTEDTAFTVRRDWVLSDLKRRRAFLDEVEKKELSRAVIADADAAVRALETKADDLCKMIRRKEQALPEFLDGLLSGVIVYRKGQHIFFEDKDESGIENSPTVELSKPADKPFGASAPLYQAFNTFCALPEETREKIHAEITRRLNGVDENGNPKDWSAEMRTACDQLEMMLTRGDVQSVLLKNKGYEDFADIAHVYRACMTALKPLWMTHGGN